MSELLIDLYKIKELYSGLGQFSINFANEIINQSPEGFKITFLTPRNAAVDSIKNFNTTKVSFQKRYIPALNKKYDIWHSLQQFPSHFPNNKTLHVLTVHDLNFLIEKNEIKKVKYLKRLQVNIDKADYITTISEYTRKVIEENINLKGKYIRTIYNGIEDNSNLNLQKPKFAGNSKFFFSIGVFNHRKYIFYWI